jgi:hypothetical protein
MRTKDITMKEAFAWDKQLLIAKMAKNEANGILRGDVNLLQVLNNPYTAYFSDAPRNALTVFFKEYQCDIRGPFTVYMKVKTKQGKGYIFNVSIVEMNFATKDIVDLIKEVAIPQSIKLVREAAREIPFADVVEVTSYVEGV